MDIHNFNPGPSALPQAVLERAKAECFDWQGRGVSVMEVSHRSDAFQELVQATNRRFCDLLQIPPHYHVLWLTGGARMQYAMLPMNWKQGRSFCFVETGYWSRMAMQEAAKFGPTHCVASTGDAFQTLPDPKSWQLPDPQDVAYIHAVDNETVHGVEYPQAPVVDGYALVSDMTSNILSRPFDINDYAVVYASSQKNMGPAGLTVVVIRDDCVGHAGSSVPTILNYQTHVDQGSLYNTPPTFVWYMLSLTLDWLHAQGGVSVMAERNAAKAKKLYDFIDASDFYHNPVDVAARSRMNVLFNLPSDALTQSFLSYAESCGVMGLKGHSALGGCRASMYNATEMASVDALITLMDDFRKQHG